MTGAAIEVDWSDVQRGVGRLVEGIDSGSRRAALEAATYTAGAIRPLVPVRTGALRSTVGVSDEAGDAVAVTYGGGLPYADYIERRTGAVEAGVAMGTDRFVRAEQEMARQEARKL